MGDIRIAEGQGFIADKLYRLVALASDQQHITICKLTNGGGNSPVPASNFHSVGAGGNDRVTNGAGIFRTWIIICHKYHVGTGICDLAHHRALTRIAIAAAAKQHHKPAGYLWPQCCQCCCKRIWGMRIIDNDLRSIGMSRYRLHAAGCRLEKGDGMQGVLQGQSAHMTHDCCGQCVHCLKGARQCQRNVPIIITVADQHLQQAGDWLNLDNSEIGILGKAERH